MEEENTEYQKLPIEERCVHKLWKARLSGYDDAAKLFQQLDDDKSPEWSKYIGLLKKFVVDSNVSAQEKGLEAVLAFIENYGPAGRNAPEVMSVLVQKCIGASRAKTKELAQQVALMYIEIEKYEVVIEELLKGTEMKNPKVAHGCLVILHQALKEFGAKVVNISKIIKKMPVILSDRDRNVRDQGKVLLVEIYRWIGPALKPQLSSLKPVQVTELEAEFVKIPPGIPAPTRLLKSQQAKKAAAMPDNIGGDSSAVDYVEEQEIDPTEFLEPVDVLSKLPKDFYTQIEAKKWTDRKDALEALEKELAAAPRLEPGDYGELVRALKKIVAKDSNVVVIGVALKCLTGLATGLKKKFFPYIGVVFPTVLEKFKEKKQNVVLASRDLVDAVFPTASLEQLSEDVLVALENKNPGVKIETSLFLARCFCRCSPTILNKKLLKIYVTALLKKLNESELPVRDAAAQAIGTAMKVVGEKAIGPFLGEPGDSKMSKIKSFCEKAELQKPVLSASTKASPDGDTMAKSPSSKVVRGGPKAVRGGVKKDVSSNKVPSSKTDMKMSSSLDMSLVGSIPSDIASGLTSEDDNIRASAYQDLLEMLKKNPVNIPILPLLGSGQGLDDRSMKVVVAKLQCLKLIADSNANLSLSPQDLQSLVMILLPKLSDSELSSIVSSSISSIAKSVDSDEVAKIALSSSVKADPKLWEHGLKWISDAIMYHNLSFTESFLQEEAHSAFASDNSAVKHSGLALIGCVQLMPKKELSKRIIPLKKKEASFANKATSDADPSTTLNLSTAVNAALIAEMTDEAWKVRHDGVAKVQALVDSATSISSDLGEFAPIIEELLLDKNSKVVMSALNLISSISKVMGPPCRQYTRAFIPKAIKNLSDPKVWVRTAVIQALNSWGAVAGYKEFFDNDNIADVIKGLVLPNAKLELWNWFNSVLPSVNSLPKDGLTACLPLLYQSTEDRSPEVRRAASDALSGFMIHLGYDLMVSSLDHIKGGGSQPLRLLLEKNRGCVPEPIDIAPKSVSGINKQKLTAGSSATFTKPQKKVNMSNSRSTFSKKKDDDAFDSSSPCLEANNLKPQRSVDEHKLKTLKWNFTTPRGEFIDQLRDQMVAANVNECIINNMFHADFRSHIKALDILAEDLLTNRPGLVANLDLILRWMTLRFFDTNPSVLLRGLEYLNTVFQCLIEDNYTLLDFEASSFVPYLLLKAGDSKDTVRGLVKSIFRSMCLLHPRSKMFNYLMDGLKSKNSRQRAEMLEHLSWLLENYTLSTCCPSNPVIPLKEVARYIGDRDVAVRNAALNCMVAVYFQEGEKLYKYVGQIPHKDTTLLEERIKRACKNRPVAAEKPLPEAIPSPKHQTIAHMEPENESLEVEEDANNLEQTFANDSPPSNQTRLVQMNSQNPRPASDSVHCVPVPTLVPSSAPPQSNPVAALKWQINQISNPDLEKAITAMKGLEKVIYQNNLIKPFLDLMVLQLVQQLVNLNQCHHPDVANCYRGNFNLLMKLSDNKPLCKEVTETSLQKLIKQILLLITETRNETDDHDMFIRAANNVVIHILESSDKTMVMCALVKLLAETLHPPPSSKHFQELVTKCIWKLHRTQAVWDAELNYERLLTEINYFLLDYPSSWWKTQDSDIPIRTVKTIIHSMVKQRGTAVKESLKLVTSVGPDSELSSYIRKLIRHLRPDTAPAGVDVIPQEQNERRLNQRTVENSELSHLINSFNEAQEPCDNSSTLRRLVEYKISHPDIDMEPYLARLPSTKQETLKRFLAVDHHQQQQPLRVNLNSNREGNQENISDCEAMWKRLQQLQQNTGFQTFPENKML